MVIAHAGDFPAWMLCNGIIGQWPLPMPEIFQTWILLYCVLGHCMCRRFSGHECCIMAALAISHAGHFPDMDPL